MKCTCGDLLDEHVQGEEQCVVIGCGCREFEEEKMADVETDTL